MTKFKLQICLNVGEVYSKEKTSFNFEERSNDKLNKFLNINLIFHVFRHTIYCNKNERYNKRKYCAKIYNGLSHEFEKNIIVNVQVGGGPAAIMFHKYK